MKTNKNTNPSFREEWEKIPARGIIPHESKIRMWHNIQKATLRKRRQYYKLAVAASIVLCMFAGAAYQFLYNTVPAQIVATKTFPTDIRLLRLNDGTRVWVNENTEIKYPKEFTGNERRVTLKGEAFFEVAKDATKPFIITSGGITTTVVGTSFTIKAYNNAPAEVHVRTGKVKVEGKQNSVFLERGYATVLAKDTEILNKERTKILEPEWKKTLIDVNNLTLKQVVEQLQHLHAFKAEYSDPELMKLKIKGTLDTRQGFPRVLETVAFALHLNISQKDSDTYYITRSGE
ncbi:FecR family protein [Flavobacterium rhizosphaerae]|uniref:FecR family protein n=1 Tax=Flavobacterium rhizosphaerae TaxID=3163298 RepID=A0ABW8YXX6_9FLAO